MNTQKNFAKKISESISDRSNIRDFISKELSRIHDEKQALEYETSQLDEQIAELEKMYQQL